MNNELVPPLIPLLYNVNFTYRLPHHTELHLARTADLCVPHDTYNNELLFPKHVKMTVFVTEATNVFVNVLLQRIYLKYSVINTGTRLNNLR